ncbi:MAG TPA: 6-phosphofructokinase, partial [Atribacterota bacterium]|nr:6-phosphofructokinase [Atribacterota bacterium]
MNLVIKKNAVIGQLGGPTSVINSSLSGLIQEGLKSKRIKHILGMRDGIIGLLKDEIVALEKINPKTIKAWCHTPSSILGSCRYILNNKDFPLILKQFKKYN